MAITVVLSVVLNLAAGLDERIGPFVALHVLVLARLGPILAAQSERLAGLLPPRLLPAIR